MALIETGIQAYIQDLVSRTLYTNFVQRRPLLAWLAGMDKANMERLGKPGEHLFMGGSNMGKGERQVLNGSVFHSFRYQKAQTDALEAITNTTSTPVATVDGHTLVGTSKTAWAKYWNAFKVPNDAINNAMAAGGSADNVSAQIAKVLDETVGFGIQRHLEGQENALWSDTLTSAQQTVDDSTLFWPGYIGLKHWVSDGSSSGETAYNYVGGVDRTSHTFLQANVHAASDLVSAGAMASTVPTHTLIRKLLTWSSLGALQKFRSSAGQLCITTGELFDKIVDSIEAKHTFQHPSIPRLAEVGFGMPVAVVDQTVITWDPSCEGGELYLLTPESWVFETHSKENFTVSALSNKATVDEGGGDYRFGHVMTKARLICREPFLQTKVKGLTTS